MLRILVQAAVPASLVLALSACDASPQLPAEVQAWVNQSELYCTATSAMSHRVCMDLMASGATIAANAFREGHEREARACVEEAKRQSDGYLDLAWAGVCIVTAPGTP